MVLISEAGEEGHWFEVQFGFVLEKSRNRAVE